MEVRRRVKNDTYEHRRVNMKIQNKCRAAKEEYLSQQCEEIKELEIRNFQIVRERVEVNKKKQYISRWQCVEGTEPS